tara:strand:- start:542 stop:727 length:186 start_codon:yes stop_codon:yes gene_type:complete
LRLELLIQILRNIREEVADPSVDPMLVPNMCGGDNIIHSHPEIFVNFPMLDGCDEFVDYRE